MQGRFFRFVDESIFDVAPANVRSLRDIDVEAVSAARLAKDTGDGDSSALMSVKELVDRDEAIFLLHTAAEVEHSLMVQYLFAAFSLELDQARIAGTAVPADAATKHRTWFKTIFLIAKQEMAHLLTVQNILRALGGPLNFDREDFPFRSDLYPYPFELRPLTKSSLARYVAAEMPETVLASMEAEIEEIKLRISNEHVVTQRVGKLYEKIIKSVSALPEGNFDAGSVAWQGTPAEWAGSAAGVIVLQIANRQDAVDALKLIAAQGEGPDNSADSHFDRFLAIYRAFPDDKPDAYGSLAWRPAKPLLHNPNTTYAPENLLQEPELTAEAEVEPSRITDRTTRYWAHLFNVRYRILLTTIAHSLILRSAPSSPREDMINWCFHEMSIIGLLLVVLADAPGRAGVPASLISAGAPFELPYTMALPDREHDRWLLVRDLHEASSQVMAALRKDPAFDDPNDVLGTIEAEDSDRQPRVADQIALERPCDGTGGIAP
jgi:hypothetical protein